MLIALFMACLFGCMGGLFLFPKDESYDSARARCWAGIFLSISILTFIVFNWWVMVIFIIVWVGYFSNKDSSGYDYIEESVDELKVEYDNLKQKTDRNQLEEKHFKLLDKMFTEDIKSHKVSSVADFYLNMIKDVVDKFNSSNMSKLENCHYTISIKDIANLLSEMIKKHEYKDVEMFCIHEIAHLIDIQIRKSSPCHDTYWDKIHRSCGGSGSYLEDDHEV